MGEAQVIGGAAPSAGVQAGQGARRKTTLTHHIETPVNSNFGNLGRGILVENRYLLSAMARLFRVFPIVATVITYRHISNRPVTLVSQARDRTKQCAKTVLGERYRYA